MKYETVWLAIQTHLDETGHGTATRANLALESGVSQSTVYRAIQEFVRLERIAVDTKKGSRQGLLFGPPPRSPRSTDPGHPGQNPEATPCLSQPVQVDSVHSEPEPVGVSQTGQTGHDDSEPGWFVCCVWEDDKGNMWCHGQDGIETYVPFVDMNEAFDYAEHHREMPHRGFPNDRPSRPRVDVCVRIGSGKALHQSYGNVLADGAPGGAENPWIEPTTPERRDLA